LVLFASLVIILSSFPKLGFLLRPQSPGTQAILLFDGICNLCNGFVNFILEHDSQKNVHFVSIQSEKGQKLLKNVNRFDLTVNISTIVLIENIADVYTHSTAALRVFGLLDPPWSLFYTLIIFPTFIRDTVYSIIANWRYDLFGKDDFCRVPSKDIQDRFLEYCE